METIKSSTEISYLFAHGKSLRSSSITLITRENSSQHGHAGRVAFIAGKKNGNAVWRNKARRRMRAICQELNGPWDNYDVVFLAKKQTNTSSYSKVLDTCRTLLSNEGIK